MCDRDNCLVEPSTTKWLKKELASLRLDFLNLADTARPTRARIRIKTDFNVSMERIAGKASISSVIDAILTDAFNDNYYLGINPRYILELSPGHHEEALIALVKEELEKTFRMIRGEEKREDIAREFSLYLVAYTYAIILCFDARVENSPNPLGLVRFEGALSALAQSIIEDENSTPELRSKVLGENSYHHRHYLTDELTGFYGKKVPLQSTTPKEIFNVMNESRYPEVVLKSILERVDEEGAPQAINDFFAAYPHFLYYSHEELFPVVSKYPTLAGVTALINLGEYTKETAQERQARAKDITQLILENFIDSSQGTIRPSEALELLKMHGSYIHPQDVHAMAANDNLNDVWAWTRYFEDVENIDERTLMSALSTPGIDKEVFTSPSATQRILSYANKLNEIKNYGLEEVLLAHPQQSQGYMLNIIRKAGPLAETAIVSPALTASEVLSVIKDVKSKTRRSELCAAFAKREDLNEGHAHYIMKHGGVEAYNVLVSNPYVLVIDGQFENIQEELS